MASKAQHAIGTFFKIRTATGPDVYTTIGEQQKITPYAAKVDQLDASHQGSPSAAKEFINGMVEFGDVSIDLQHIPGGVDEALILGMLRTTQVARTVYPSGAYAQYSVNISDWQPENPHDGKATGSLKCKITGMLALNQAAAPENTLLPSIAGADGTASVGDVLTAIEGAWNKEPTSFTYQWKNAGVNIVGATSKTYTLQAGDSGDSITVAVVGVNSAGSSSAATSLPVVVS